MPIDLSPEIEAFIEGKVASGYHASATEVIRDAIRRMQAEEIRLQAWKAALKKGDDERASRGMFGRTREPVTERAGAKRPSDAHTGSRQANERGASGRHGRRPCP